MKCKILCSTKGTNESFENHITEFIQGKVIHHIAYSFTEAEYCVIRECMIIYTDNTKE